MKKYKCPYCQENTYTLVDKILVRGMASKGRVCPKCGKRSVTGLKATIFKSVLLGLVFIAILYSYISKSSNFIYLIIGFFTALVLSKIFDILFCEFEKNNRLDV